MLVLRPYQEAAKAACYRYLRAHDDNPCIEIPTGGGKTPLIASICQDAAMQWNGRVLILAHVKELLTQVADKLKAICPDLRFGIYSAGLKRRDTDEKVIIASIQSVHNRACDLGAFNLILVDEAHLIPPDGEGRYRRFLADAKVVNPEVRVIGLTATPYRMKSGELCTPEGILNSVCYRVSVTELIRDGYLCPLISKGTDTKFDTSGLRVRGGEYVHGDAESLMTGEGLVEAACAEIIAKTADRHKCLIFAAGVDHGRQVCAVMRDKHGIECGFVCGETPAGERDQLLQRFRDGDLKYLANVNVLTTGFDAPNIDCIVMLRPTLSPGLYFQSVGRGFRIHGDKSNCLVLDFAGNVLRHGPVDRVEAKPRNHDGTGEAPGKECPACASVIAAGCRRCPDCGYAFPPPERIRHASRASEVAILSGEITDTECEVRDIRYSVHRKKNSAEDSPRTMRVTYQLGLYNHVSEYVCFEHKGYPRGKAVRWWKARSVEPVPETAEEAVRLADGGALCFVESITVRKVEGEKYDRIIKHKLGDKPEPVADGNGTEEGTLFGERS